MKKKILITDDHTIVRRGVVSLLKEHFPFFEMDEAESFNETISLLNKCTYDLIILDLNLADGNAEGLVKKIKSINDKLPIVVFSMFPKEVMEGPMLKLGVSKYVNKSENLLLLRDAVESVFQGKNKINHQVLSPGVENPFERLSPKELSVMFALLEGLTNAEIAVKMDLKASTIATYKQRVFEKLSLQNTTQLVKLAIQFNIYSLSLKNEL